ncbi:MAG TPA: LuxR C-terminal-related transcriptional regulator [Solirubrobacteraceae bacterium]|jgi:DNA-binding CsgD family transcriptional regulator|nr:LuxR C-terminal-related transcriptional regulator [Solirubrobacteraceae bacterium]
MSAVVVQAGRPRAALERARVALARGTAPAGGELLADVRAELGRQAQDTVERLAGERPDVEALTALVLELDEMLRRVRHRIAETRLRRLARVDEGLARLRALPSTGDLAERVCEELVVSCELRRALLSRVEGDRWTPWRAYFPDDPTFEAQFVELMSQVSSPFVEMRPLAERRPALVRDALSHPRTHEPIVRASRTNSYVAMAIACGGRIIGFLHADHGPDGPRCDEVDRDALWAFATGFEQLYERRALEEQLLTQRERVRERLRGAESIMDALCDSQIELARRFDAREAERVSVPRSTRAELDEVITPREREVLELMVRGASNATIADRLVLTEGTVKSHVKHILRKVGAVNRSEAIAKYVGLFDDE